MSKHFVLLAAVAVSLTLGAARAEAQNGQISGIIKDDSGGVIPGATVSAQNSETGLLRSARERFGRPVPDSALPPGRYSVKAELTGFTTEMRSDVTLVIDQNAILNFGLKPAALAETVTVTGGAADRRRRRDRMWPPACRLRRFRICRSLPGDGSTWRCSCRASRRTTSAGSSTCGTVNIGAGTRGTRTCTSSTA